MESRRVPQPVPLAGTTVRSYQPRAYRAYRASWHHSSHGRYRYLVITPYQVLELCAAPGGKSTHLAELMGDGGRVLSVEVRE